MLLSVRQLVVGDGDLRITVDLVVAKYLFAFLSCSGRGFEWRIVGFVQTEVGIVITIDVDVVLSGTRRGVRGMPSVNLVFSTGD